MTEASNLRFIIRRRDEQITALRKALAELMPWMPEGDSRTIPEEWVRAAALAATEPEAKP